MRAGAVRHARPAGWPFTRCRIPVEHLVHAGFSGCFFGVSSSGRSRCVRRGPQAATAAPCLSPQLPPRASPNAQVKGTGVEAVEQVGRGAESAGRRGLELLPAGARSAGMQHGCAFLGQRSGDGGRLGHAVIVAAKAGHRWCCAAPPMRHGGPRPRMRVESRTCFVIGVCRTRVRQRVARQRVLARGRRGAPKPTGRLPSAFTSRSTMAERTCVTPACSNRVVCRNFS
jgi:hypothetical protein